jgi:hypothetical protein
MFIIVISLCKNFYNGVNFNFYVTLFVERQELYFFDNIWLKLVQSQVGFFTWFMQWSRGWILWCFKTFLIYLFFKIIWLLKIKTLFIRTYKFTFDFLIFIFYVGYRVSDVAWFFIHILRWNWSIFILISEYYPPILFTTFLRVSQWRILLEIIPHWSFGKHWKYLQHMLASIIFYF